MNVQPVTPSLHGDAGALGNRLAQPSPSARPDDVSAKKTDATGAVSEASGTKSANEDKNSIPGLEDITQATEKIRKFVEGAASRDLSFSVDDETGVTVVKVIDRETKELIRQIPAEEALQIARTLDKLQGLFIKQQA